MKKKQKEKLTSRFESWIEKQGKDKKLTETSFERFHEADDEGGTARDLLQHLRHLKQYPSEYAEYAEYEDYATISFRICKICNNIVQNMQNMRQDGTDWFKLWICPELSVSSKYFHPFCPDPFFQCSFSL